MRETILLKLKWVDRSANALVLYYLIYNTWFGWNKEPENQAESVCDTIMLIGFFLLLGFVLHIILNYIKYRIETDED